jgi:hypothetical protein
MGRKGRMEKPKFGLPRMKKGDNEEGKDEFCVVVRVIASGRITR